MYPRIPLELVTDTLGNGHGPLQSVLHTLGNTANTAYENAVDVHSVDTVP